MSENSPNLRPVPPGELLRRIREELNLSQTEFGQYYDRTTGILASRMDHALVSKVENWGSPESKNRRRVTQHLLEDWWECCDYWFRRLNGTPPTLSLNQLLAMLNGVEAQGKLVRSLGKRVVTIGFFADSGSSVESMTGFVKGAAFFGLDHVEDFPCGGRLSAFIEACRSIVSRAGDNYCHIVLVELPPDEGYSKEADTALRELVRQGEAGFKTGHGYVTVVAGLSPLHHGVKGTRDPCKAISKEVVHLVSELARQHRALTGGTTRVVTVIGGAACVAYNRNDEVVPALTAELGELVATEVAHPGSSSWIRGAIRRHFDGLRPNDQLVVVPLYFSATRLLGELVPSWDARVKMVSTDVCQEFLIRMGEFPDRWLATVAADVSHAALVAVAFAERLSLAFLGTVDPPEQESLALPAVVVTSGSLDVRTPMPAVREDLFIPALRNWVAKNEGLSWLRPVVDGIYPLRARAGGSAVKWLQSLPLPYAVDDENRAKSENANV
jgi:hypothetical protein